MSLHPINPVVPQPQQDVSANDWNKTTPKQAAGAAEGLAGCWRKDEAHDPDRFAAAVTSVFTLYSPDVVQYVCDPRTGLPKTNKWPPTISEVHDACRERIGDLERAKRYKNWGNNDPDERERQKDQGRLPVPVEVKPTFEQMQAKYGVGWGLGGVAPANEAANETAGAKAAFKTMTPTELAEHYSNHGLSFGPVAQRLTREPAVPVPILDVDGNAVDEGADF